LVANCFVYKYRFAQRRERERERDSLSLAEPAGSHFTTVNPLLVLGPPESCEFGWTRLLPNYRLYLSRML
jgi:hypothetical protein